MIQEIKKRILLSSIVGQAVELKGRGSHFLGLCPFHKEKTPSFHVRDHLGSYKCFGCGASGDIFAFIMRIRGIAFKEALGELCDKAGIEAFSQKAKSQFLPDEQILLHAQAVASRYFVEQLFSDAGRHALRYLLEERRLKESMLRQAGLGFGGVIKNDFINYLLKNNIKEKTAIEAGLLKPGAFSLVPQFLGRITIPIKRVDGKIIAFGGRSLLSESDNAPKYVNTQSYKFYEKKKNFYGVFESQKAILKGKTPFLVEGYFDAMALWAIGVPALALCGTALSDEHIKQFKRISSRVIICFDDDKAGFKALKSSLVKFWQANITTQAVVLEKKDPGDYLALGQLNILKERIQQSIDATCLVIERVALNIDREISSRIHEIDELLPILASISRPLVRRQYVAYLANKLHEDPGILWTEISQKAKKNSYRQEVQKVQEKNNEFQLNVEEKWLLEILYSAPDLMDEISDSLWERVRPELRTSFAQIEKHHELIKQLPQRDDVLKFSLDEAREMLSALQVRVDKSVSRNVLKAKRQKLQEAEKNKDFASVFETLREQSSILAKNKIRNSKPREHSVKSSEEPKKVIEIAKLDSQEIEFDCENDWF